MGDSSNQLGSKLEAQEGPKSSPKAEKIDVEKCTFFGLDFRRVRPPFSKDFLMVFERKRGTDFELRDEAANPKNSDFP